MTSLQQLVAEGAVDALRRRHGRMLSLGSEEGTPRLDWVDAVERLLTDGVALEAVEAEAEALYRRGIRHLIWSGMGGSIMAVRVLLDLGLLDGRGPAGITVYPLDSTDPAALNAVVAQIAGTKGQSLPVPGTVLPGLWDDVLMVGVAMGMTSEEPITHLQWFASLLENAGLALDRHLLVMALPDSYLERFARSHRVPILPLQADGGNGTGGRMSAPSTRVFLLPAALALRSHSAQSGGLRQVLKRAWQEYDLAGAVDDPAAHPYVCLAAHLTDVAENGVCRLMLHLPGNWSALLPWIEQLMEESLGKGGKGVVVFPSQELNSHAAWFHAGGLTRVDLTASPDGGKPLAHPLGAESPTVDRLVTVAAAFLGWQLCMALYGYLHDITFAGQPAVEDYKARARKLRDSADLAGALAGRPVGGIQFCTDGAAAARSLVDRLVKFTPLLYLDLTINGELATADLQQIGTALTSLGNTVLGVPVKLRRAPAAYHASEQSEMDGPAGVLSVRALAQRHEPVVVGRYDDTFLIAQAVSTCDAMAEVGRPTIPLLAPSAEALSLSLLELLTETARLLTNE